MRTPCSLNKFTLHIILQAINESDIIMSFVNYGHQEEFEFTRRFWFDVTEVRGGAVFLTWPPTSWASARKIRLPS